MDSILGSSVSLPSKKIDELVNWPVEFSNLYSIVKREKKASMIVSDSDTLWYGILWQSLIMTISDES